MYPRVKQLSIQVGLVFLILALILPGSLSAQDASGQEDNGQKSFLPITRSGSDSVPDLTPDGIAIRIVPVEEQVQAKQYWTRDKYESAQLYDMSLPANRDATQAMPNDSVDEAPVGEPSIFSGGLPNENANEIARQLYADQWRQIEALDQLGPTAANATNAPNLSDSIPYLPYTSYYVNTSANTWQNYPWKTMGRLFFQIPGLSGGYTCSASVAYRRSLWTTGHCLYTPGRGWHYNVVFVPAYRDGNAPYGSFTMQTYAVLNPWVDGYPAYDVGTAITDDQNGHPVSWWVGYLGAAFNIAPWRLLYHSFGYPYNLGNDFDYLIACVGGRWVRDDEVGPDPVAIDCDMKGGSSGGPWLIEYAPFEDGSVNYVNGLNSYGYNGIDLMYSPYFGDNAKRIYDWGKQY